MRNFGERVKQLRTSKGLSQDELAKRMGYSNRSSITHLENNRTNPSVNVIKKVAEALEVSPAVFYLDELFSKDQLSEFEEYLPFLAMADKLTLIAVRKILDMPPLDEKRAR